MIPNFRLFTDKSGEGSKAMNFPKTDNFEWVQKRKPGNIMIGLGLVTVIGGIYYFTIHSISKNDFAELENDRKIKATTTKK